MTNCRRQANALAFSLFKHQIKPLQRGVGGPGALPALAILMQPFSLQTKQHFFFFFVAVYHPPTMVAGGQLERRTSLSCVCFSIHARLSTRRQSMSVSLRLARRSVGGSRQRRPFILTNLQERIEPEPIGAVESGVLGVCSVCWGKMTPIKSLIKLKNRSCPHALKVTFITELKTINFQVTSGRAADGLKEKTDMLPLLSRTGEMKREAAYFALKVVF